MRKEYFFSTTSSIGTNSISILFLLQDTLLKLLSQIRKPFTLGPEKETAKLAFKQLPDHNRDCV